MSTTMEVEVGPALIAETKQQIMDVGRTLFDRHLTDAAGGNLSVRLGDIVLMSPRYAGSKYWWHLRPDQILTLDLKGNRIDGDGDPSREVKVHMALLNEFYEFGNAVVHCHAKNVLVFCAATKNMPVVLESTAKFGEIKVMPFAPAHSQELADAIASGVRGQEERIKKGGAAVMASRHGLFVMAKDLLTGYDSAERIDENAYCVIHGRALADLPGGDSGSVAGTY